MKGMILIMFLSGLALDSFALEERKLTWSRSTIAENRDRWVRFIKRNIDKIENSDWLIGVENNWEDCLRIYDHAVKMGWTTSGDVEDWKAEAAAPDFVDGVLDDIALKCGPSPSHKVPFSPN